MRLSVVLLVGSCGPILLAQQVPPSLVVELVPPVPAELVKKLAPYQNIRQARFSSWHPTSREMLIATRFGETTQVHRLTTPGGARTQITFFREPVSGAIYSPAGKPWFLFTMDEGGGEFHQIYRYDFETGRSQLLTDGKSRNQIGPFSTKGDRLVFSSSKRNGRDNDLYIMNPEDPPSARMAYEAKGSWWPTGFSNDDTKLLAIQYLSINETIPYIVDLSTGSAEPVFPPSVEKVAYMGAFFSHDGKGIYISSDHQSEFRRLCYLDLATKKLTPLTAHLPWDVDDFDLSRDGLTLAFITNEDGVSQLRLMSTATRNEIPGPKLPPGVVSLGGFHPALPEVAFSMVSAKSPGDVFSFNWKSGELTRWTNSEAGGLNTSAFPETDLIRYPTFDKVNGAPRLIPAFIVRPPARFKPPYPVIVSIHGGPEAQALPQLNSSYMTNEMGIATIKPNVRGSSGYGKTYLKLDNAEKREDSVRDIGALLDWIAKQPDLDAKRVAVMGGSYGGYMTLASSVHFSDRLKCGIDVVGISNWVSFLKNTQSYRQDLRRAEYGNENDPKMRDLLETISPLNNTHKIKIPLLIVQGRNDPRVPVTESLQMVKKLREGGNPAWYIEGKDEGHGFVKKPNRDYQTWAEVLFLNSCLLP